MSDENATPGATFTREDSSIFTSESSRLQGLLDEIKELKRIVLTTAKARDEYRDDYYRVHNAYMDFKYPSSRPRTANPISELEIQQQIKAHAASIVELSTMHQKLQAVHPDHPAGSREPPHCSTCRCGLPE